MSGPEINVVFPGATILAVVDVARDNRWEEIQRFNQGERRLEEVIFELPDGETVVRGIDDHVVAVVFASITGPQRAAVENILRGAGRAVEAATLWQWAESNDPKQRSFALRAFAATSNETADPRVVALYTNAVKDENPEVRSALVEAVGRAAWLELWPIVDELACGGMHPQNAAHYRVIGIGHVFEWDKSLHDVDDLEPGWEAERQCVGGSWMRTEFKQPS